MLVQLVATICSCAALRFYKLLRAALRCFLLVILHKSYHSFTHELRCASKNTLCVFTIWVILARCNQSQMIWWICVYLRRFVFIDDLVLIVRRRCLKNNMTCMLRRIGHDVSRSYIPDWRIYLYTRLTPLLKVHMLAWSDESFSRVWLTTDIIQ